MSSSKRLKPKRMSPLLMAVAVAVAVALVTLLLVAEPSQGQPAYEERDQYDNDANYKDEPVVASRAWGGNNKTEHVAFFPWIFVLFRNPDDDYKWPLDGYQTGYALELHHNLFLINNYAITRATRDNELMAAKRAKDLVYIDPNKSEWPPNGQPGLGNLTLLASIGWDFGIYRLTPHDKSTLWPQWPLKPQSRRSLSRESRQLVKDGRPVPQYPSWNQDKDLETNCYVYTFAAQDWRDVDRGAVELGVPSALYSKIEDKFYENETRTFSHWPVKLAEPCNKSGCKFVYDMDRYLDEDKKDRFAIKRARGCPGWQDVGAPIMCGSKSFWSDRLKLSYVVRTARQNTREEFKYDPKRDLFSQCWSTLIARKLTDYTNNFEPALEAIRNEYWENFKKTRPYASEDEVLAFRQYIWSK